LVLVCGLLAPARAGAQELVGHEWGSSTSGVLAIATEGDDGVSTLRVVSAQGQVAAAETVGAADMEQMQIAVGARGDVLVAWVDAKARLWTRYRPADGRLGAAEAVARNVADVESLPLGLDATGGAIVGWVPQTRAGRLHVRFRGADGRWGAVQALGSGGAFRPKLALADSGNAVITWTQHAGAAPDGDQVVASTRPAGGRFGAPQLLAGVLRHAGSPTVAANDRGEAAVGWVETHGDRLTVAAAFRRPGHRFGRAVALSRADASAPALAVLPSGTMILAWRRNQAHRVEARVRSAAGVLAPTRLLSRRMMLNERPLLLRAGRGAVVWSDDERGVRVIRVAQATDDLRFTPPATLARISGKSDEPALASSPTSASIVADPPMRPTDPIVWQPIVLPH
jgi:hypothetical protein